MATGLVYDDRFLEHDTGLGHPERPERLRAIVAELRRAGLWDRLEHLRFGPAGVQVIAQVHERRYIERVRAACEGGGPYIDTPDSAIGPASYGVALLAVGGVLAAADAVMDGRVRNAFCAVRPPGHHAEHDRSMGFCLFNNVAIAAEHLIAARGLRRVAIVDFDVHHGNGTQHLFEDRGDVLYISLHEHPACLYPGTGYEREVGVGAGYGYTLNIPLAPGSGDEAYQRAFEGKVVPALERFEPQMLLVSAGFDAAEGDPLAHMRVSTEGFAWMSRTLVSTAERLCGGRLVSTLEGGYDLTKLAEGVAVHVGALMETYV